MCPCPNLSPTSAFAPRLRPRLRPQARRTGWSSARFPPPALLAALLSVACQHPTSQPPSNVTVAPVVPTASGKPLQATPPADSALAAPPRATRLTSMLEGACAVLDDGTVSCWGGSAQTTSPRLLEGVDDALDVTVGFDHDVWTVEAIIARTDGSVVALPIHGGEPRPFIHLHDVVDVEGRVTGMRGIEEGLCVIHKDRTVTCFNGGDRVEPGDEGHKMPGWTGTKDLALGWTHVCALADDGVRCIPRGGGKVAAKRGLIADSAGAVSVVCEHTLVCVGFEDGRIACADLSVPSPKLTVLPDRGRIFSVFQDGWPDPDSPMICVAAADAVSCRRESSIGSGFALPTLEPGRVSLSTFGHPRELIQTQEGACARTQEGTVACWGHNGKGLLARPFVGRVQKPLRIVGVPPSVHAAVGEDFSCALTRSKKVWCWGGTFGVSGSNAPREVPSLTGVEKLIAQGGYACTWDARGQARCFFGRGPNRTPLRIAPLDGAVTVGLPGMGFQGSVAALFPNGTVSLGPSPGFDSLANLQLTPIAQWNDITHLALGGYGSLVVQRKNGEVLVGHVQNGAMTQPAVAVPRLRGAAGIRPRHVRMPDGSGVTWTDDPVAGDVWQADTPLVALVGPNRCARTQPGNVVCASTQDAEVLMHGIAQADGSEDHICGVDGAGDVWCVGENRAGQCGAGAGLASSSEPLEVHFASHAAENGSP